MLWEVEIYPAEGEADREAARALAQGQLLGAATVRSARSARSFLIQGALDAGAVASLAQSFLADTVVERCACHPLHGAAGKQTANGQPFGTLVNILFKPGVTDNVAESVLQTLRAQGQTVEAVRTCQKYWFNADASPAELQKLASRALSNDAIQQVVWGALSLENLAVGSDYTFRKVIVPLRNMRDVELQELSRRGQLYLSLPEMQTIRQYFLAVGGDPTDIELETIAQTWSEHCSHKTLKGKVAYRDEQRQITFKNMLKETVFAATTEIRRRQGANDWCVSVFQDNAGVVRFDERQHVCFKVETHNHPSALEPYGGANTGLGGVIRDPMGTGLGAKPLCNTDVFCFAPPDMQYADLPPGVLHPRAIMEGVVAGVRDYGNRMGIPTVNGAVFFDERYLGNPLVFCGNVAMLPVGQEHKQVRAGDLIVSVGGRTGRDGIHGATFSSAELTHESETLSGGSVQIGNAITEKMVLDVILQARDRGLYSAITDCGAGGFSSAVGEMAEGLGAVVHLERCPLKYAGLSYTEIWISEAQERMVLAVPPKHWEEFRALCAAEGVEATAFGEFLPTGRLELRYAGERVGDLSLHFLHEGRPPVVREAVYQPPALATLSVPVQENYTEDLRKVLGSLNVCSKEWIIRQYDHEVQAGSVVKPLVGAQGDGPSDAAVVRPDLKSWRGLAVSNGMNPRYGDFDPYWMAAAAIDEAVRNCVAVGADPDRIAILDNFCWGNTDRPETLGSLVRAALACRDVAIAYGTPFVSGKDSLNNEFTYVDSAGKRQTVAIPPSLLISALGQLSDVRRAVTMDLKEAGNTLFLMGTTRDELGGSHWALVRGWQGGQVPHVDVQRAPALFRAVHQAISAGCVRACHDLSEGGLAASVAEMAFAGERGATLALRSLAEASGIESTGTLLFSESTTRFLVEVPPVRRSEFEKLLAGLPCVEVGVVTAERQLQIQDARGVTVLSAPLAELKEAWQTPLAWE